MEPGLSSSAFSLLLLWISVCECRVPMYGQVQSPLYPDPYPANLHTQWDLEVPKGYKIKLTFYHLDIEQSDNCFNNSLTVLYGKTILGRFCGQKSSDAHHPGNKPIMSPGNRLQLVFVTDDSNPGPQKYLGFSAFYQAVAVDCGIPEISDPDLMVLKEENPLTTYKQNVSFQCASEHYQLVGDDSFTCNADGNWEQNGQIVSTEADFPKCLPVCGINNEVVSAGRVFGGEKARLGQIPWQLLIKRPRRGGASLISDRWAVTAAQLVDDIDTIRYVLHGGMIDGRDQNATEMVTEKVIIHPDYKRRIPGNDQLDFDNDIALLKMSARVKLSPNLRPVCLPEKTKGPVMEGKIGTVSGFGATEDAFKSALLKYGYLKEYSEVPCFPTSLKVTNNMFCAGGYDDEEVDSCRGDSGGPLVIPMLGAGSPETPYQLKGIVSWGPARCGDDNLKGYYTKVENYLDWIKETMEKN